jgi:hypothetical protein
MHPILTHISASDRDVRKLITPIPSSCRYILKVQVGDKRWFKGVDKDAKVGPSGVSFLASCAPLTIQQSAEPEGWLAAVLCSGPGAAAITACSSHNEFALATTRIVDCWPQGAWNSFTVA